MIAKLAGIVDQVGEDSAVIDVGGVGYLAFCSTRTIGRLPPAGAPARLLIETHVREDHIHLYGFIDAAERDWFRLLTTVQGVGARLALAILSAVPAEELGLAIFAQDKRSAGACRRSRAAARRAHRQRAQGQGRRSRPPTVFVDDAGILSRRRQRPGRRRRFRAGQSRLSGRPRPLVR